MAMRERPILFRGPMVRAILANTKTQTRRAIRPQPLGLDTIVGGSWPVSDFAIADRDHRCPYGRPGDRLWVREAWQHANHPLGPYQAGTPTYYRADYLDDPHGPDGERSPEGRYRTWRPSIHMPRTACRILLEITGVRVERLLDISIADAMAEGVVETRPKLKDLPLCMEWRYAYEDLWNQINGRGAWHANPWVWVVEFKRLEGQHPQEGK